MVLEELADFIENSEKYGSRKWLSDDLMQVYVRRGLHRIEKNKLARTLDIANITVFDEGKGTFGKFIAAAHKLNPWDATYVECVQTNRLAAWLLRNGWLPADNTGSLSFYLLRKNDEHQESSVL